MSDLRIPIRQRGEKTSEETAITAIDGGLQYRGYLIEELVEHSNFLETAFLLVKGDLPSQEQLADVHAVMHEASFLDEDILALIERIPLNVPAIDVLRTGINLLAVSDLYEEDLTPTDVWNTLLRLLAQLPLMIAARQRLTQGLEPVEFRDDLSYAGNIIWGLTNIEPTPHAERALDAFLVLSAEHELAPSTYVARVVSSTRSDFMSAVIAGICAIKGIWHGGPGQQAIDILEAVEIPEAALPIVQAVLKQYERLPGFWHRVYATSDPRAELLRTYCQGLAPEIGKTTMEEVAAAVENAVWLEQQILPSFDWSAARLLHYLGFESDLFNPLFVVSRVVGWAAHFNEQQNTPHPIRPRANYVGPATRPFRPLTERG